MINTPIAATAIRPFSPFKKILLLLTLLMCTFSSASYAAATTHTIHIARIYLTPAGDLRFQGKDQTAGCQPLFSNHYYHIPKDSPFFDGAYSILLAAAYAQTPVAIRLDNAACNSSTVYTSNVLYVLQNF